MESTRESVKCWSEFQMIVGMGPGDGEYGLAVQKTERNGTAISPNPVGHR